MSELYNKDILRWTTRIPHHTRLQPADVSVVKTSRICGSQLTLDVCFADDQITMFGQQVKACALGQASAAIVGQHIIGLTASELADINVRFTAMVETGVADFPDKWADLSLLAPVHEHPGRRGSVMLPFECLEAVFRQATI
ncbi:iron-sulfur cluster assembly scaffold protein [Kordiimonas aquimaris]|uniref:iron-sulfur cluster assembly scaffold protein n=1 Tax=Kordiimonas aquimaris TaxID=707591 RepID=UPI0021D29C92|nr:iron-sulfur cluster assembly scaffold protein [Kordiimonas aquimaris]